MTQSEKLGIEIVVLFNLRKQKDGKYQTSWGSKTLEGIGNTIFRLVEENENNNQ